MEEELFIPKTKHKALKIILAIILVIGLAVGGYFLYQYKFNNPKTIVTNILEEAKNNLSESLVEETKNNLYKIDGYFKADTNIKEDNEEMYELLKNLELQFSGEIDPNNSIGNFDINTKYKSDKLIDFKAYYEKNIIYLLLEDVYDKYLKINTKEDESASIPKLEINPQDMQTLANSIVDALKTSVEKQDIKKSNETIKIDGKDVDVINNYIELKDKEFNSFAKDMFNALREDKNFKEVYKKITNQDANAALDALNNDLEKANFEGIYKINFYTDKSLFNKKLISVRQTIAVTDMAMSFTVDKISDDEIFISLSSMGVTYSVKLKKTNSTMNIKVNIDIMGEYISAEINMNYEKIKELTKPDLSNSKDINDLTDEENKQIGEKLQENKVLVELMEKINGTPEEENTL